MKRRDLLLQFLRFSGVGAIGTVAHYAILIALVQAGGVGPVLASSAGFAIGALVNYLLSYHFVFASREPHWEAGAKFLGVALAGIFLNALLMSLGTQLLQFHYLFSQILATMLVLLWNFSANRRWTFSGKKQETSTN